MGTFEELFDAGLGVIRTILIVVQTILGMAGVTLTLTAYQKITSGGLSFGPADVEAGHAMLMGFIGVYLIAMVFLKAARFPAALEGLLLGLPLGGAISFLLLQKLKVPMHVFVDTDPLTAAVIVLALIAWIPYPHKA